MTIQAQQPTTVTTPPPIKKIILHNIQAYQHAEIEPAPPGELTCLIGPSDAGKTTLGARAQLKLGFDDYPTKKMIRRGAKKGHISYIYDTPDNLTVSWCFECPVDRSSKKPNPDKAKAWYEIARDGFDTVILEGGGKGVPEAIQQITGMRLIQIGKEKLNFNVSKQLAGPFMGGGTPNDRYRILGILAGTLEVDAAVKGVSTEIIQARREETKLEKEIKSLDEQVAGYDWLEVLGADIEKVEAALARIRERRELKEKLLSLKGDIEEDLLVVQGASEHSAVLSGWIDELKARIGKMESASALNKKLTSAQAGIVVQKETIYRAENVIHSTQTVAALQTTLPGVELKNNNLRGLVNLSKQITADKGVLVEAERIVSLTIPAPEVSIKISALDGKQITLTILKRAKVNIETENKKVVAAVKILALTETHKMASEACERLSRSNHIQGLLVQSQAVISKAQGDIKRYAETVWGLAGAEQVRAGIGKLSDRITRSEKLVALSREIVVQNYQLGGAVAVLKNTSGAAQIPEIMSRFAENEKLLSSLKDIETSIMFEDSEVSDLEFKIGDLDERIRITRSEYRKLLLKAGICEGCKVVDAVMAAS